MATEQTNPRASPIAPPTAPEPRALWGRRVAVAAAVVFVLSSAFPVVAGLSQDTTAFPAWWGPLDVGVAVVLAILALVVHALAGGHVTRHAEDASYHAYRQLTHAILALILAFFFLGDRIVWINCLPGFAWRAWLLLYSLPAWFTALGPTGSGKKSSLRAEANAAADRPGA
jgi:hypothetical protein